MSKYLDRLHALEGGKNAYIGNPQNPQKPFEPFEGRQVGRFSGAASPIGGLLYDPARLQREADRRNAAALRAGLTDAFCRCGHLAEFTWVGDGREVWRCQECIPTWGRA